MALRLLGARPPYIATLGEAIFPGHGGPCPGKTASWHTQPRSLWNGGRSLELCSRFPSRSPGCTQATLQIAPTVAVVHQPIAGAGATGYATKAPTIVTLLVLQRQPALRVEAQPPGGNRRGRNQWLPRGRWTWRPRLGSRTPPPRVVSLCCPCTVVHVRLHVILLVPDLGDPKHPVPHQLPLRNPLPPLHLAFQLPVPPRAYTRKAQSAFPPPLPRHRTCVAPNARPHANGGATALRRARGRDGGGW